jgi:UDP-glucose 4-epimerase
VLDPEVVEDLTSHADVVVHLAAAVGVRLIVERPLDSLLTNIRGTENVLAAANRSRARVLVASTSEIYGKNTGLLGEESDRVIGSPFVARWSYSTAKAVDEILAHAYWREEGLQSIVVRLFNCVGPRQTGEYGMVVPTFVRQALGDEPITVHGTGSQQRAFCHVYDTVAALVALIDHPDAPGRAYNIGAPNEISILDLARTVIDRTGSSSEIDLVPYEAAFEEGFEDMDRRVPDTSRITDLTGWEPQRSLDDILDDAIAFERERVGSPS